MPRHLPSWLRVALGLLLVMQAILPYRAVLPPPVVYADSLAALAQAAAPALAPTALPVADLNLDLNLSLSLDLRLTAAPAQVEPGDVLTYTATVANAGDTPLTAVVLTDTLPAGLVYVAQSAVGFAYDPRAGQLTWAVGALAPGVTLSGSFQARVQGAAIGEPIVNRVVATAAELAQPVTAQAMLTVKLPVNARAQITPAGGVLIGRAGRVLLVFAAGSVTAPVEAAITAAPADTVLPPQLLEAFQLTATDAAGRAVTRFARPVTVVLNLALYAEQLRTRQGSPSLYTLDETSGQWQTVPTVVDWGRNTATATVDHFSVYAAGTSSTLSYGAQHLPTVHGFVTDEWSGNSSMSYPLALPPGPGGLGLNLSLGYSSEGVNSIRQGPSTYTDANGNVVAQDQSNAMNFSRQASFVGWGWSLSGLGQVTVNLSNAKAYLGYAGGGFELKYDATNGWQTEPQSFVRIAHTGDVANSDPWYVWTPDGTKYTFGGPTGLALSVHGHDDGTCGSNARESHLTEVRDPHGNWITVTYATESRSVNCGNGTGNYVRAIRPTRIEYFAKDGNLASVRVDLIYGQLNAPPPNRTDTGVPDQNGASSESFWSDYRLTSIIMQVRNGTATDAFATVRSYTLSQDYLWQDQAAGKGLLRLTGITEQGRDGGTLPAWSFTYTTINGWLNHTLLETANNGQGGQVTYAYVNVSNIWMEGCGGNTSRYRVSQMDVTDGLGNTTRTVYNHQNPWAHTGAGFPDCPDFEFGGYTFVRSELKDGADNRYRVVDTYYHQRTGNELDPRKGKAYLSQTSTAPETDGLARVEMAWLTQTISATNWVFTSVVTNTVMQNAWLPQRTEYVYDTSRQGGRQYGNVTHVREYSDAGATLYRTRERWYYPNNVAGGAYIVNRLAQEKLWQGNVGGTCKAQTRFIYDNPNNSWTTLPTLGDLVKQRQETNVCDDTGADAGWVTSFYGYDGWGNRIAITDTLTHVTTTAYDTSGAWPKLYAYPISETLPAVNGLSLTTVYTWDKVLGQVTSVTDPNNAVTSYVYDEFGRQIKLIKPGDDTTNPTVKFSYNNYAGATAPYWVKQEQKESGASYLESRTFYDGLGRGVQTQAEAASSSQSIIANTRYNPLGVSQASVPYTITQPLGGYRTPNWSVVTQYAYDALGRTTVVTNTDGTTVTTAYQGRQVATLDELGRQTIGESDAFGRLVSSKQYNGVFASPNWSATAYVTATYSYTVRDQLSNVVVSDGVTPAVTTSSMTYDTVGRKTAMTDADLGAWSYAYDAAGNLTRQTDARNQTLCFYYDALNRLTGKHYRGDASCPTSNPALAVGYTYDAGTNGKGRRTSMADNVGVTTWGYDARGRLLSEARVITGTGTFLTTWGYDTADRVTSMRYPANNSGGVGEQVNYGYTSQGLLNSVVGAATYVQSSDYDAAGRVDLRKLGADVLRTDYVYFGWTTANGRGRLQQLKTGPPAQPSLLQDLSYTYDAVGNVKTLAEVTNGNQKQCLSYDPLDRLTQGFTGNDACTAYDGARGSGVYTATFGYADNERGRHGNLTQKGASTLTYNAPAPTSGCMAGTPTTKPHAAQTAGGNLYRYDCAGNVISRTVSSATTQFNYDAENRLVRVTGAITETHAYDGDGVRVRSVITTTGGVTTTVYIGNYFEWVSASITRTYYYAGNARVAERVGSMVYYLFGDHLGSTSTSYRSDGGQTVRQWYGLWGGNRGTSGGALPTDYGFTGQRLDSGTGLLDYGARWYDPVVGRFLAADTIVPQPGNPQALNRYSYVLNNPLRYTDPTGMFSEDEIMKYLGVDTWDDVLAAFGQGGRFAGQWGWLQTLRQAEIGSSFSVTQLVCEGELCANTVFEGTFGEDDSGALRLFGSGISPGADRRLRGLTMEEAVHLGKQAGMFYSVDGTWLSPQKKYLHPAYDFSKVKTPLAIGAAGIAGDYLIVAGMAAAATGNGTAAAWAIGLGVTANVGSLTQGVYTIKAYRNGDPDVGLVDAIADGASGFLGWTPQLGTPLGIISLVNTARHGIVYVP